MNNSIRNTIILLFTLLAFAGGGWFFINYIFQSDIEESTQVLSDLSSDLDYLTEITEFYPVVEANYYDALYMRENHPKELFHNHNTSQIYNYLQELNNGNAATELNFSFTDSLQYDNHGIINVRVRGEGLYQNLVNFIYRIEHSRPLIKINTIEFDGISDVERLNRVNFEMTLGAYYKRGEWSELSANPETVMPEGDRVHNPTYPLIHSVPPNEDNLPDVENSRLLVLTQNRAHIIDQTGNSKQLSVGDRVYLGRLSSINMERGEAHFQLNRGGIADRVILTLEQENQ
ncbi:MAG: hypothetical protein WDZ38_00340 [Balneolaceae bacterium]